ncbi:MAG: LolA-related protein [Hylemonella sp.]|nr:LolA-related protein [Hylemonella sp.]
MHRAETTTRTLTRILLLALLLSGMGLAQAQATFGVEQLFALMAGQKRLTTTYTEQKFIKGLDAPVESSGELLFEAPSRMVKRTLLPKPETLMLDGAQATVERGRQQRTVTLEDHPEVAVHVEGLRACLAGDLGTLVRIYFVSLSGTAAQWKMTLVPRDAQAAAQVQAITLGGEQADIRTVQVLLSDGDSSLTRIARPQVTR